MESTSSAYSFSIAKEVKPPILSLEEGSLKFTDQNNNGAIDAFEKCSISFVMLNKGYGDGLALKLKVKNAGNSQGITFSASKDLATLKVGQKTTVDLPIESNMNTLDGNMVFTLVVEEPNGFGLDPQELTIPTRKFVSPMVEVADYSITSAMSGQLVKKMPFDLQVLVQNTQHGLAEDVSVRLEIPENVICVSDNLLTKFDDLKGGQTQSMVYSLIVSQNYAGEEIPITVKLSEKYKQFSKDYDLKLKLNQQMASNKIEIKYTGQGDQLDEIKKATLTSDVDKNIPPTTVKNPHIYALIIGNKDYTSYQTGLNNEVNVDFADNDADVFAQYVKSTLGAESEKVRYIPDATVGKMKQGINWLTQNAENDKGNAEIIFYYSGHGLPDEETKEAYLMPVDISATNIRDGIKLDDVITSIAAVSSKRATLFIDACFSGGARNQGLLAVKGARFKPSPSLLKGKLVMFSSSSGEESSGVYREKQHGFFTYYLLKKLQETKGDINYMDLGKYLKEEVKNQTTLISKPQTPDVQYSKEVENEWGGWKMK